MKERKFFVAGVQHHELHRVINDLVEGDELDLTPEPTNKFDPNAVRIEYEGTMLGYVPARFSAEISAMIEAGVNINCTIESLTPSNKPWEQLEVVIMEDDDEDSTMEYEESELDDDFTESFEVEDED